MKFGRGIGYKADIAYIQIITNNPDYLIELNRYF